MREWSKPRCFILSSWAKNCQSHYFVKTEEMLIRRQVKPPSSLYTGDSVIICLTLIYPGNTNPPMPAVSPSYWSCVLAPSQSPSMLVQCGRKLSHDGLHITGYLNVRCTMMGISYSLTVMKGAVRQCGAASTDWLLVLFCFGEQRLGLSLNVNLWKVRLAFYLMGLTGKCI